MKHYILTLLLLANDHHHHMPKKFSDTFYNWEQKVQIQYAPSGHGHSLRSYWCHVILTQSNTDLFHLNRQLLQLTLSLSLERKHTELHGDD